MRSCLDLKKKQKERRKEEKKKKRKLPLKFKVYRKTTYKNDHIHFYSQLKMKS